jgi:hypothetical protein
VGQFTTSSEILHEFRYTLQADLLRIIPLILIAILIAVVGVLIRKTHDTYNIRKHLAHTDIMALILFTFFLVFGYFGWVPGFPLSIVWNGAGNLLVCYFITWKPVNWCQLTDDKSCVESSDEPHDSQNASRLLELKEIAVFSKGRLQHFYNLMQSPAKRDHFQKFVAHAFAVENLYFYHAMMVFRSSTPIMFYSFQ